MNFNSDIIIVNLLGADKKEYREEAVKVFVDCFYKEYKGISKDKKLYEYLDFKEYEQQHSLVARLMGFGYVIKMKRQMLKS